MMQSKPGSQVEKSSYWHCYKFYSHCWLSKLVLGHIDEAESGKKGKIVESPIETENCVKDDVD